MVINARKQPTQAKVLVALQNLQLDMGYAGKFGALELTRYVSVSRQQVGAAFTLLERRGLVQRTRHVPTQWSLTVAGTQAGVR